MKITRAALKNISSKKGDEYYYSAKSFFRPFFNSNVEINEYDKCLSFGSDGDIEDSIVNFLDATGFLADDNGYKFLKAMFFSCIKRLYIPSTIGSLYRECETIFGVKSTCIDMSIAKAIASAQSTGKLAKANDIFRIDMFCDNDRPTNAVFISSICNRFIYCKKYGISIQYRA